MPVVDPSVLLPVSSPLGAGVQGVAAYRVQCVLGQKWALGRREQGLGRNMALNQSLSSAAGLPPPVPTLNTVLDDKDL